MASLSETRPSVASELEAIFAPLPRIAPAMAADAPSPKRAAARRTGLLPWIASLAAIALAALIGSLLFLRPVAPAPHVARTVPAARAPLTGPTPAPAPRTETVIASPHPAAPLPAPHEPAPAAQRTPRPASLPVHRGRCPRFATEAWCLHGTIMAADDRLRDAYDDAARAGVDRTTLVGVRNDWKSLRGRANRDPQALIRGYALLTEQLRAEIRRAAR